MLRNISFALLVSALIFVAYLIIKDRLFPNDESFEMNNNPGTASPIERIVSPYPERTVASSGPNPPNQMPSPDSPSVRLPGAKSSDPYEESYGSSSHPEELRHPERLFGPSSDPDNTQIAVDSGVAALQQETASADVQTFSPDSTMNGGQFMGSVSANDTYENHNYSSI